MVKVLDENSGIDSRVPTTVHNHTNDQSLLDGPYRDPRRARSAALSIIPTSMGAARAVGLLLPEPAGALDGVAVRVPAKVFGRYDNEWDHANRLPALTELVRHE